MRAFCRALNVRIYLSRVLNISRVLDMPRFRIWQGSEFANVTQKSNMPQFMAEYVRTGREYA